MERKLHDLIPFEKSARKAAKDCSKRLRKRAKKARKKDASFPIEEAREELSDAIQLAARHADLATMREDAESRARADLVVDGQVLLEQVPARVLLGVHKQTKRVRKAARELARLHDAPEFRDVMMRAEKLSLAAEEALDQANQTATAESEVSAAVVAYLSGQND